MHTNDEDDAELFATTTTYHFLDLVHVVRNENVAARQREVEDVVRLGENRVRHDRVRVVLQTQVDDLVEAGQQVDRRQVAMVAHDERAQGTDCSRLASNVRAANEGERARACAWS